MNMVAIWARAASALGANVPSSMPVMTPCITIQCMASSATDSQGKDKDIRESLVRSGHVDVMVSVANNFFYTKSLPCSLWFFAHPPKWAIYTGTGILSNIQYKRTNKNHRFNR